MAVKVKLNGGKTLVPITGSTAAMRSRPPVRSTSQTSRDAEEQILQPPQPFANRFGTVNLPTGRQDQKRLGIPFERPAPVNAKPQNVGTKVGCANTSLTDDEMAAIGYSPRATKSSNPIISGHPTRGRR